MQIITGEADQSYKPHTLDKVIEILKSNITPQFQLFLGSLKEDEFKRLASRLTVIG
jgi:hypothetical protein